jgi:Ferritin-like domain
VVSTSTDRTSRRDVLIGSGVVLLLAGCGAASDPTHRELAQLPRPARHADVRILNAALDLEYELIAAYTAGIPLLAGAGKTAAQRFLGQDLSHAGELQGLVHEAGGKPNKPQASYKLGQPRDGTDVLRLLHSLESAMIAAYLDAIPLLSAGHVRASVASMLANEGQHVSILRAVLGRPPIPSALVTGRE